MLKIAMHAHLESASGVISVPDVPSPISPGDDVLRGLETLLFLSWDPADPGPWFARLARFPLASGAFYVTWELEGQQPQIVAHLAPVRRAAEAALLWRAFLQDFFAAPAAYHAELLDPTNPPQTITNYRPDLLPRAAIQTALEPLNPSPGYFAAAYLEEKTGR